MSALIAQFVEKIEERDVKDGKVSSTTAVTDKPYTGDITDLFGNVLNETVVVDDAHTPDKKQQNMLQASEKNSNNACERNRIVSFLLILMDLRSGKVRDKDADGGVKIQELLENQTNLR